MKIDCLVFNKENSQTSGNSGNSTNPNGPRLVPTSPSTNDYIEKGEKVIPIQKKGG